MTVRPAAIMADRVSTLESGSAARASRSATEAGPTRVSSWPNPTWIAACTDGEVRVVGREAAYGDRALPHDRVAAEDEQRVVPDLDPGGHRGGAEAGRGVVHPLDRLRQPELLEAGEHRRHLVGRDLVRASPSRGRA